jgi:hypothetical protein
VTPIILLDRLEEFVKENTKDIILQVRVRRESTESKERAADVYKMKLPTKDDETQKIPYILLQFLTGKDSQKPAEETEASCKIRIVVATYSEDGGIGAYDVLNVLLRIRSRLIEAGIIGNQFALDLEEPLEYIVYPEDTAPYYLGEMVTTWSIPSIKKEVNLWQ